MERNHIIGFIFIFVTLYLWTIYSGPSPEEMKAQRIKDSLALAIDTLPSARIAETQDQITYEDSSRTDSSNVLEQKITYGGFYTSMIGQEET